MTLAKSVFSDITGSEGFAACRAQKEVVEHLRDFVFACVEQPISTEHNIVLARY